MSAKADNLRSAAAALAGQRPLLYISDPAQAEAAAGSPSRANCPLAVRADGLEALADLTAKIAAAGRGGNRARSRHARPEGHARGADARFAGWR